MKKTLVIIAVFAMAVMAQAATLTWQAAPTLTDTLSGNGYLYYGTLYATPGVDLYLIYNGVGGSIAGDVVFDKDDNRLEYDDGSLDGSGAAISFLATTATDAADYATGGFTRDITGVALDSFGETVGTWEAMNNRNFSILAVSDTDGGDYSTGAWFGLYSGNAVGFSTGTGASGTGYVNAGTFDASGDGLLLVVPEPATIGLFGLGALSAWILRRNKAKQA